MCLKLASLRGSWFPILYIYKQETKRIEILKRLISKRHFENTKELFGVSNIDELRNLINLINEEDMQYMRHQNAWEKVPSIKWQISPEEIGTLL